MRNFDTLEKPIKCDPETRVRNIAGKMVPKTFSPQVYDRPSICKKYNICTMQ